MVIFANIKSRRHLVSLILCKKFGKAGGDINRGLLWSLPPPAISAHWQRVQSPKPQKLPLLLPPENSQSCSWNEDAPWHSQWNCCVLTFLDPVQHCFLSHLVLYQSSKSFPHISFQIILWHYLPNRQTKTATEKVWWIWFRRCQLFATLDKGLHCLQQLIRVGIFRRPKDFCSLRALAARTIFDGLWKNIENLLNDNLSQIIF